MDVGSKIYGVITNVTGGGFWDIASSNAWNMIWTEKGIIFARIGSISWKDILLDPFTDAPIRPFFSDAYKKEQEKLKNLPLNKIMEDKKNWFVSYDKIKEIKIRSGIGLCGFDLKTEKYKKSFTFPKSQKEIFQKLVNKFLPNRLKKGWF